MKLDPAGHREQKIWIPSAGTASAAMLAAVSGQPLAAAFLGGASALMATVIWAVARSERRASARRVHQYLAAKRRRPGVKDQVRTLIADLDEAPKPVRQTSAWTDRVRRLGEGELKAECVVRPVGERRYSTSRRARRLVEGAWGEECAT